MALVNALGAIALEATQVNRYGGGKTALTATVSASGDTTLHTPPAGQATTLYWISAIADPQASTNPLIIIKFGSTELYRVYAVAHWEIFVGAVNQALVVNLSSAGTNVAITAHYKDA